VHANPPTAQIQAGKQCDDALRRRLFRARLRLLPKHPQHSDRLGPVTDCAGPAKSDKKRRLDPGRSGKIAEPVKSLAGGQNQIVEPRGNEAAEPT
jgi:hypothetical protein